MRRFLCVFNRKTNKKKTSVFALEELKGLLNLFKVDVFDALSFEYSRNGLKIPKFLKEIQQKDFKNFPFIYVDLPSPEIAEKILRRSVLIGMFLEIFSEGKNLEEIFENMQIEKLRPFSEDSELKYQIFEYATKHLDLF